MRKEKSRQIISAYVRVPATQVESEKVTDMVGTFLNKNSDGLQKIRVTSTQVESEKVTNMVGTFLNKNSDGLQKIRVTLFKWNLKRLPIWWEPF